MISSTSSPRRAPRTERQPPPGGPPPAPPPTPPRSPGGAPHPRHRFRSNRAPPAPLLAEGPAALAGPAAFAKALIFDRITSPFRRCPEISVGGARGPPL